MKIEEKKNTERLKKKFYKELGKTIRNILFDIKFQQSNLFEISSFGKLVIFPPREIGFRNAKYKQ